MSLVGYSPRARGWFTGARVSLLARREAAYGDALCAGFRSSAEPTARIRIRSGRLQKRPDACPNHPGTTAFPVRHGGRLPRERARAGNGGTWECAKAGVAVYAWGVLSCFARRKAGIHIGFAVAGVRPFFVRRLKTSVGSPSAAWTDGIAKSPCNSCSQKKSSVAELKRGSLCRPARGGTTLQTRHGKRPPQEGGIKRKVARSPTPLLVNTSA